VREGKHDQMLASLSVKSPHSPARKILNSLVLIYIKTGCHDGLVEQGRVIRETVLMQHWISDSKGRKAAVGETGKGGVSRVHHSCAAVSFFRRACFREGFKKYYTSMHLKQKLTKIQLGPQLEIPKKINMSYEL
jgi:hypothetical protein